MNIYGTVYLLNFFAIIAFGAFNVLVIKWAKKEAHKPDKYAALVNKLQTINNYAQGIVANVAVDPAITKSDSKQAAVAKLASKLNEVGINVDQDTLSRAIESAYQSYKAAGKDTHVEQSPLSENEINEALDGAQTVADTAKPEEDAIVQKVLAVLHNEQNNQGSGQ